MDNSRIMKKLEERELPVVEAFNSMSVSRAERRKQERAEKRNAKRIKREARKRLEYVPIDVWGERNGLLADIKCHLENSSDPARHILQSVRQWAQSEGLED
jgi:hypothetical protein